MPKVTGFTASGLLGNHQRVGSRVREYSEMFYWMYETCCHCGTRSHYMEMRSVGKPPGVCWHCDNPVCAKSAETKWLIANHSLLLGENAIKD